MGQTLSIFNPDHDLANANGTPSFVSPNSSIEFGLVAAWIPAFINPENVILSPKELPIEYQQIYKSLGINTRNLSFQNISEESITSINPWGWDAALVFKLQKAGIKDFLLPSKDYLANLRVCSHREFSLKTFEYISDNIPANSSFYLETLPTKITTFEEATTFLTENKSIVLKMPWSGSGKGLRWCRGKYSEHDRGWIMNTIHRQGCVMGEKRRKIVRNFAMEFFCDTEISFCGYSLFKTGNGIYQGNLLDSNINIINGLKDNISKNDLESIQKILIDYFKKTLLSIKYHGYFGVDMFLFDDGGKIGFNPCVEINLRTTMGIVARKIYDNFLAPNKRGEMRTIYYKDNSELIAEHSRKTKENPLQIRNGKIESGYFSLCPVYSDTHYLITIDII